MPPARGYVGKVDGTEAYVGVVGSPDNVVVYVCDGKEIASWFSGAPGPRGRLEGDDGATLDLRFESVIVSGVFASPGGGGAFSAEPASGEAGLFRKDVRGPDDLANVAPGEDPDGVRSLTGWVRLNDGTLRGLALVSRIKPVAKATTSAPAVTTVKLSPPVQPAVELALTAPLFNEMCKLPATVTAAAESCARGALRTSRARRANHARHERHGYAGIAPARPHSGATHGAQRGGGTSCLSTFESYYVVDIADPTRRQAAVVRMAPCIVRLGSPTGGLPVEEFQSERWKLRHRRQTRGGGANVLHRGGACRRQLVLEDGDHHVSTLSSRGHASLAACAQSPCANVT